MAVQEGRRPHRTTRGTVQNASLAVGLSGVAAGSRVLTRRGEVLVEGLKPGEEILTAQGTFSPVRAIDLAEPPQSGQTAIPVASIRVRRDAFGPMRPYDDVLVGAGQILLTEQGPALAASLLNGRTVVQDWNTCPRLIRIALDKPGSLLVDGIAVAARS